MGALRAAIHADDNGQPAPTALKLMSLQAYPRPGVATFYGPGVSRSDSLADTTYWLVVDAPPSATRGLARSKLGLTEDSYDECVAGDWSFAGVVHEYDGATLMNPREGHAPDGDPGRTRATPTRPGPSSRPAAG